MYGKGREGSRGAGRGDRVRKGGEGRRRRAGEGRGGKGRGVPPLLSLHFKHCRAN